MSQKYADIIIDISHEAIDRTFQYIIPDELIEQIEIGMMVIVPFGQGSRNRKGYVIDITDTPSFDVDKMKYIKDLVENSVLIEGRLIKLAAWIRSHYGSTMINAINTVMPVREKIRKTKQKVVAKEYELANGPVQELSNEQNKLVEEFSLDYAQGKRNTYLLHGVTGSGKTEVYIECIKNIIKDGRQAIVLIPEIGLTYQNVARFKQHFGDRVAVINSKQSKGEKYQEMLKAKDHQVDVIIGPRSALFTPCEDLGLIIIDEEHEGAYKSDQTPKYHAREVAIERARLEKAAVILGSATPSIESYAMAKLGKYKLWELKERPNNKKMAKVSVVDLRDELRLGNRSIVSNKLYEAIKKRLENKEQVMLFINRRGYNSFVSCRECGEVIKCPKCDVSLSLHNNGIMMCHYCGHTERAHKECPSCKSKLIGGFGTGTEKVEQEINKLFPEARTLRMDKDTTSKKGDHSDILTKFLNHEADILIGTQMIVKGHDFPNVTLVGVMLADMSLYANDYKAGERTFDLLTQAAGRAGRGEVEGEVVIQTYQPEHYAILSASKQDYERFFDMEMSYRRLLKYPPVYNMMVVLMVSDDYDSVCQASKELHKIINEKVCSIYNNKVRLIGPSDATICKINNIYRRVLYVKFMDLQVIDSVRSIVEQNDNEKVSIMLDVNPENMY